MKTVNIMKAVCVAGLAATCVWGLAACGGDKTHTGGVAATVNGVEIAEDEVTDMVEGIRAQMNISEPDAWGQWLADNARTPESVREDMIDSFVQQELIKQGAQEKAISVEAAEIDHVVNAMKGQYEDEETWQAALEQAGFTEEKYRQTIEGQLLEKKLTESFASEAPLSDEEILEAAQMYAMSYDGAKRSSHILFESGDEATAQDVLDQINSGQLDFGEAAAQYSQDNAGGAGGSAAEGGDVGWDKMSSFVPEYTDALNVLEKDQVSGLVTSQFGIHIIKCTDVFNAPKEVGEDGVETVKLTSIDQIPAEFVEGIEDSLKQQKQMEATQAWFTEFKENADIQINPMPEGVPYAVDMSKYTPAEGSPAAQQAAQAESAQGATEVTTESDGVVVEREPATDGAEVSVEQEGGAQQPVEGTAEEKAQPADAA